MFDIVVPIICIAIIFFISIIVTILYDFLIVGRTFLECMNKDVISRHSVCIVVFISCIFVAYFAGETHYIKKNSDAERESWYKLGVSEGIRTGQKDAETIISRDYAFIKTMMDQYVQPHSRELDFILTEKRIGKIIDKSNPKISDGKRKEYIKAIMKWSDEFDMSPIFIASIIHRETNFRENLVSSVGCVGPMQVYPKYHKAKLSTLGVSEKDLNSINYGIAVGTMVIREYLENAGFNYREALSKYVGAVTKNMDGYVNDIFEMTVYGYEN